MDEDAAATLDGADLPPDELTIPLRKPIATSGQEITSLTLREPTAGEMKEADKFTGYAWMTKLVALVTAYPESQIDKLGVSTLNQASAYLSGFIDAGRKTRLAS